MPRGVPEPRQSDVFDQPLRQVLTDTRPPAAPSSKPERRRYKPRDWEAERIGLRLGKPGYPLSKLPLDLLRAKCRIEAERALMLCHEFGVSTVAPKPRKSA